MDGETFSSDGQSEPMGKLLKPAVKSRKYQKKRGGILMKFRRTRTDRSFSSLPTVKNSASDASIGTDMSRKKTPRLLRLFSKAKSRADYSSDVESVEKVTKAPSISEMKLKLKIKHPIEFVVDKERSTRNSKLGDIFKQELNDSEDEEEDNLSEILSDKGEEKAKSVRSAGTKGKYLDETPDLYKSFIEEELKTPRKKRKKKPRRRKRVKSVKLVSTEEQSFLEAEAEAIKQSPSPKRSPIPVNPFEEEGDSKNSLRKTFMATMSRTLGRGRKGSNRGTTSSNPIFLESPHSRKAKKSIGRTLSDPGTPAKVFNFEEESAKNSAKGDNTPSSTSSTKSVLRKSLKRISRSLKRFVKNTGRIKSNKFVRLDSEKSLEDNDWSIKFDVTSRDFRFFHKKTKEMRDTKPEGFIGSVWVTKFSLSTGRNVWFNVETKEERDCKSRPSE